MMSEASTEDYFPDHLPRFGAGQIIRHRKYGYRGVIVDFDMSCQADEEWYWSNPSQPDKNQPWYHVLVDGSTAVTYVVEENLEFDSEQQPIHHPLVPHLFHKYEGGGYERNDTPWPGWDAPDHSDSDEDSGHQSFEDE